MPAQPGGRVKIAPLAAVGEFGCLVCHEWECFLASGIALLGAVVEFPKFAVIDRLSAFMLNHCLDVPNLLVAVPQWFDVPFIGSMLSGYAWHSSKKGMFFLFSLKSENFGNDPNINLVPAGGSGWGSKEQPGTGAESTGGAAPPAAAAAAPAPAAPPPTAAAAVAAPPVGPPPTAAAAVARGVVLPGSEKSWSNVTSGPPDAGPAPSYLAHQSPYFQQEFPSLAAGDAGGDAAAQKKQSGTAAAAAGTAAGSATGATDTAFPAGPSLRPTTEGSWTQGGGRRPEPGPPSGATAASGRAEAGGSGSSAGPPASPAPLAPAGLPLRPMGPPMLGMGGPMPPPYRGMMPPYMMRPGFPGPAGYPPSYPPGPAGIPPRPGMYRDQRGEPPRPPPPTDHRPIIKAEDLKSFDEIANKRDDGWAGNTAEVDYK